MPGPTTPGRLDLRASRWVPFKRSIDIVGIDLSGQLLLMQVRQYRDASGGPLVDLATAAAGAQGLSVTVTTINGLPTSTITIQINETTLEGVLPFPTSGVEAGADVTLVYDLLIGTGAAKARWLEGSFTIVPGATQA